MTNPAKQKTLMKRRKQAIILSAVAVVVLIVALIVVLDYVETYTFEEGETTYYIRKKDGVYAMYDQDRNLLKTDDQYGYYITALGTLVEVDAETGDCEVIAVVDTEGNEVVGFNSRLLLFPHIEKKNILTLEVHNEHGEYTFVRFNAQTGKIDKDGDFVIQSSPLTSINQELFAGLYVGAGYTLSLMKITDPAPIKDEAGEFSEYGLVPEWRQKTEDEEGNELETPEDYLYEPAYYILTDVDGNRYKVIIGDPLVDGSGYYAQYVEINGETETKRDAVYVLDTSTGSSITAPIEEYVTPLLSYPMTMNTYFDVEEFTIGRLAEDAKPSDSELYEKVISFSYIDLSLRENTLQANYPYQFSLELDGYTASSTNIDVCLQSIYDPSYAGVTMLSPLPEDLAEYGIYTMVTDENGNPKTDKDGNIEYTPFAKYAISFYYDILNDDGTVSETIHQLILISEKNENGNYYAYTAVSNVTTDKDGNKKTEFAYTMDMIVEIEGHTFEFLNWDSYDWINSSYINDNIAFVTDITLTSPNYTANFKLDNSLTDVTDGTNSGNLTVSAGDSLGHSVNTFGMQTYVDVNGYLWVITTSDLLVYEMATGTERDIAKGASYYDYNVLGSQVLCKTNVIDCDGYDVEVKANEVNILYDGSTTVKERYVRYDTSLFRKYYQTMLYASIVDSYELTEEEETALLTDPEKWLLTLTVTTEDQVYNEETKQKETVTKTTTYSFYQLSSRKAYITINGNGGFYVQKNRVDKFITDAQRFFNLELIEPTDKT